MQYCFKQPPLFTIKSRLSPMARYIKRKVFQENEKISPLCRVAGSRPRAGGFNRRVRVFIVVVVIFKIGAPDNHRDINKEDRFFLKRKEKRNVPFRPLAWEANNGSVSAWDELFFLVRDAGSLRRFSMWADGMTEKNFQRFWLLT